MLFRKGRFFFAGRTIMNIHDFRYLIGGLALFILSSTAQAITYGETDCDQNEQNCKHPNVVVISGFNTNGITTTGTRCSGTLIHYDANKVVILSAGHCTAGAERRLYSGVISTVGVSFDPVIHFFNPNSTVGFDDSQFITTGKPVTHPDFSELGTVRSDWGLYLFPNTGDINAIVNNLSPAVLPPMPVGGVNYLDSLNLSTSDPNLKFHAVGYGLAELHAAPGNDPKSLPNPFLTFGTRKIADPIQFLNLRNNPVDPIIEFSTNPGRDLEGICHGDSGGPTFLGDSSNIGTLVAVTSWGDTQCRAVAQNTRTDVPNFLNMVNVCAKDPAKTVEDVIECVQTRAYEN
jgi:hypothetical protein